MSDIPDILKEIAAHKLAETAPLVGRTAELAELAAVQPPALDFPGAFVKGRRAVIAEVKKASPSAGVIVEDFDPPEIARGYARGGASAISVLTDLKYFKGDIPFLRAVKAAVGIPVLRKDFIVRPEQIYESRAIGADSFLLIAALLSRSQLQEYLEIGRSLGMEALVESHDEEDIKKTIAAGARIAGINNRDLRSFEVDLAVTERLAPLLPPDTVVVGESGVASPEAAWRLYGAGCDAILVGEYLMRAKCKELLVRLLKGDV